MGVGSGTGVGGSPQPPQIREFQTTAFVENMKKTVLAMLPADTYEVIPWTQREQDEVFKYRSEAGRPMLHPLMFLRASLNPEIEERIWQPYYEALLDTFPSHIKERMTYEMTLPFAQRDTDYVVLNYVLSTTAKAIDWLLKTAHPIEPESGDATLFMLNMALPYVAMRGALAQTETILLAVAQWIQNEGANHIGYDKITAHLKELNTTIAEFNVLRGLIEQGENPPEVKNRLILIAERLHHLKSAFPTLEASSQLLALGTSIETLSALASAWALSSGSLSLFISSEIALGKISNRESQLGILGDSLNKIFDTIVEGLLCNIATGPQTEVRELLSLYDELTRLK